MYSVAEQPEPREPNGHAAHIANAFENVANVTSKCLICDQTQRLIMGAFWMSLGHPVW